jgi:hypothetical protein
MTFLVVRVCESGLIVEFGDVHKLCRNDIPMKVLRWWLGVEVAD